MSWYLTIRGDSDYSRYTATAPLVEFLSAIPELRQVDPVTFETVNGQPWACIVLAMCDRNGSYASHGAFVPQINVVEIVCSYSYDPAWYDTLASRIAELLSWSAFEDHSERQVWPRVDS